ncbi:MAG: dihydrofolate reductase family protein [Myxococcales bacterium]
MGKLVAGTFVSVDGVMQAPGGPDEDRDSGFALGGWSHPYWGDPEMDTLIVEQTLRAEAVILGRKTWQIFAGHWPKVTDPADPIAGKLNSMRKYVASRTLAAVAWNNSVLLGDDVPAAVRRLKEETRGELQVTGSWKLLQTLIAKDLVDEFHLWQFPVVLGRGKRLFGEGAPPGALRLDDTRRFSTGVVVSRYSRAGAVKPGSFALG